MRTRLTRLAFLFSILISCVVQVVVPGCGSSLSGIPYNVPKLQIDTSSLDSARVSQAYNNRIVVSGGTPPYYFTDYQGFPAGMSFDPSTGIITGTPLVAQNSGITISVTVQDSGTPVQVAQKEYTLIIKPLGVSITTTSLESGNYMVYYRSQVTATNGLPPYTWKIGPAVGSLPAGLHLDSQTGVIEGIPTQRETQKFTITVTDDDSPATTHSKEFTLEIQ